MGLTDEQIEFALANYNTIANLELLTESENKKKNDAPFNEWIKGRDTSFKKRHCIPDGMDYTYDNFKTFIEERKKILHDALKGSLGILSCSNPASSIIETRCGGINRKSNGTS